MNPFIHQNVNLAIAFPINSWPTLKYFLFSIPNCRTIFCITTLIEIKWRRWWWRRFCTENITRWFFQISQRMFYASAILTMRTGLAFRNFLAAENGWANPNQVHVTADGEILCFKWTKLSHTYATKKFCGVRPSKIK